MFTNFVMMHFATFSAVSPSLWHFATFYIFIIVIIRLNTHKSSIFIIVSKNGSEICQNCEIITFQSILILRCISIAWNVFFFCSCFYIIYSRQCIFQVNILSRQFLESLIRNKGNLVCEWASQHLIWDLHKL